MSAHFLWQNGEIVAEFSLLPSSDRVKSGFWLGDGIFETLLVDSGQIFALTRHVERLNAGAQKLSIDSNPLHAALDSGLELAVAWLQGRIGQIRISLLSSGDCLLTAKTHELTEKSAQLTLYPFAKNQNSVLAGVKTLSYGENAHALRYARSKGFDDVVFLNLRDEICESALANLLLFDGSNWWTPPLSSGALPGVTRELLIAHFNVCERTFSLRDLSEMKALALTSSLRDIQPISKFEDHSYLALNEVARLREDFRKWRRAEIDP